MNDTASESPDDDVKRFFVSLGINGAEEVRKRLTVGEAYYRRIYPQVIQYARDYYLYGVLDQIERACIAFARLDETLEKEGGQRSTHEADRFETNVLYTANTEAAVWIRRLTEVLVELIHFTRTNRPEVFHHYLLSSMIAHYRAAAFDMSHYHGRASANIDATLSHFLAEEKKVRSALSANDMWYLASRKEGQEGRFAPFRDLLDAALPMAKPVERLTMGLSYDNAYGKPSRGVHWTIGPVEGWIDRRLADAGQSQVIFLAHHVLLRCRRLLRIRTRQGATATLAKLYRRNKGPVEMYRAMINRHVRKRDFVIVQGELAEVRSVSRSQFGYRAYLVRFLQKAPITGLQEDWYPANAVRAFIRIGDMYSQVQAKLTALGIRRIPPREMANAIRDTVVHLWEHAGLRETAHGDRSGALEKIRSYAAKVRGEGPFRPDQK